LISKKVVSDAITQLKRRKAPSVDGIAVNHLQNTSPFLTEYLALFFNMCVDTCLVLKSFFKGIVTNILRKGKKTWFIALVEYPTLTIG